MFCEVLHFLPYHRYLRVTARSVASQRGVGPGVPSSAPRHTIDTGIGLRIALHTMELLTCPLTLRTMHAAHHDGAAWGLELMWDVVLDMAKDTACDWLQTEHVAKAKESAERGHG